MDATIIIAALTGLLAIFVLRLYGRRGKFPPGPWGLPIVGYVPFLSSKPYLDFQRLAKKYGNIFSIRLGSRQVIILNDFQSTKDAFVQDAFIGRPPESPFETNKKTQDTKAFDGLPWMGQRRFSLHMLRDLGLGKSKMEEHIREEIRDLLDGFERNVGKPYCVYELLASSMSNNISSLVFGKRLKYDDPIRQMMNRCLKETTSAAGQVSWQLFFPWIKNTLEFLGIGDTDRVKRIGRELRNYTMKEIIEHEETLNPNNIRDFIDGYLLEIEKRKEDPSFCSSEVTINIFTINTCGRIQGDESKLKGLRSISFRPRGKILGILYRLFFNNAWKPVLQDLVVGFFGAGSETVRLSVEWLVLTAAVYQDAQIRVQQEIDEVIGRERMPNWLDHKSMPLTQAFIMELMRWRTIIPINVLRYAIFDGQLNGYHIPKHSYIIANLWSIHHNPEYWGEDAEEFKPERFLGEDGRELKKWEHFIPFSIGKRACPGEPLARTEVFMYFASILQRFHLKLPDGKVADFEGELGIGLMPKAQELIFTKRS